MEKVFINNFIPDAVKLDVHIHEGIYFYEDFSHIFALVNTEIAGILTNDLMKRIAKVEKVFNKSARCIALYKTRRSEIGTDTIANDSYCWFLDEPNHCIHFDKNPKSLRPRKVSVRHTA